MPKPMALTPFVSICHAGFSMFGRVKSGTINASQLFFQGSHVFSIFKLRIHACNKHKNHYILPLAVKISDSSAVKICSIRRSQFQRQVWDQAQNHQKTNPVNTLRPRDSFCFLLVSSHFFYPNFKRPIPSQKWILKQQVPLNIPKQRAKILCQCTNPFRHLATATPERPENPSGATAIPTGRIHRGPCRDQLLHHGSMAFLSRPMQRRPASGAEDVMRKEQQLRLPSRNKA